MSGHEDHDERVDRLLALGLDLAASMRDDVDKVHRVVAHVDRADLESLACVLAALVPVHLPLSALAWWRMPLDRPSAATPCGTRTAATRHRDHGEKLDALCRAADGAYMQGYHARRVA